MASVAMSGLSNQNRRVPCETTISRLLVATASNSAAIQSDFSSDRFERAKPATSAAPRTPADADQALREEQPAPTERGFEVARHHGARIDRNEQHEGQQRQTERQSRTVPCAEQRNERHRPEHAADETMQGAQPPAGTAARSRSNTARRSARTRPRSPGTDDAARTPARAPARRRSRRNSRPSRSS